MCWQVASCTLDASTKIYAYRVDCVHTDTMRMAGGLGRTQQEKGAGGDQGAAGEGDSGGPTDVRKKKRVSNPYACVCADCVFSLGSIFKL